MNLHTKFQVDISSGSEVIRILEHNVQQEEEEEEEQQQQQQHYPVLDLLASPQVKKIHDPGPNR